MGWVVKATLRPLSSLERPSTHCVGVWVGPRAGLEMYGKSRPPLGFDPWTVQPVASLYTDGATQALPIIRTLYIYVSKGVRIRSYFRSRNTKICRTLYETVGVTGTRTRAEEADALPSILASL